MALENGIRCFGFPCYRKTDLYFVFRFRKKHGFVDRPDVEKKFPASAFWKKKIACSTNVIESLWEKRGKSILPTRLLEKKFLMTRNRPPHPPQELNGRPLFTV